MDKQTFISEISDQLKKLDFKKAKSYWYKYCNDVIFCIHLQSSQWDPEDYYVEIGVALSANNFSRPSLLQWYCRHRCCGITGDKNILPGEFMLCISYYLDKLSSFEDVEALLREENATKVASQYWF